MKFLMVFVALLSIQSMANASIYICKGGSFSPIKVEVISSRQIVINQTDIARVDEDALMKDRDNKKIRLVGNFSTIGDGSEGYSVSVAVTPFLLINSKIAFLNTYNRGPDGFYSESYKCLLQAN